MKWFFIVSWGKTHILRMRLIFLHLASVTPVQHEPFIPYQLPLFSWNHSTPYTGYVQRARDMDQDTETECFCLSQASPTTLRLASKRESFMLNEMLFLRILFSQLLGKFLNKKYRHSRVTHLCKLALNRVGKAQEAKLCKKGILRANYKQNLFFVCLMPEYSINSV